MARIVSPMKLFGIGKRKKRKLAAATAAAEATLAPVMQQYQDSEYVDPYASMENIYEDLTVNTQQAEFQKQMALQQQADTLDALRSTAGASGAAGLAQVLSGSFARQQQQASASIGEQERKNQLLALQGAEQLQRLQAEGQLAGQAFEQQKLENILQFKMADVAAALGAETAYQQQLFDVGGQVLDLVGDVAGSFAGNPNLGDIFDS